ncbi:P-loop containing nucleoside triphosphate hydrolase [Lasallia pustulata]|uniref:p-loop containing nucleoside triphosphate hydrolase n=1 Tax=Lasallia pustulata TaxID=136370 RepID=A0A1W5D8G1_9LECA|nr:P-loop containing nucleoside triphosphate hydrolase [Lasallia pustulata]
MAEGLALAASIVAILQITNSVISVCHGYGAAAKDAPWELSKVNAEMKSLRNVLQTLQPLAEQAEFASPSAGTRLPTLALLCGPRGLLNCCLDEVRRLDERLENPSWSDSFGPKKKAFIQALRWPLNKAETMKVLDDVSRYRNILNLAITADQTTLTLEIQKLSILTNDIVLGTQRDVCLIKDLASDMHADVQSTKSITLGIQLGTEREKIHRWLSAGALDPSINQNRASRSRQANTGLWFVKSETFTYWKASSALVWLHGKAGCGKTVLSSTIINAVLQEPQSKSEIAVAYFYFDFNDVEKQKSDKMIRSLITQLSRQSKKKLNKLEALFSFCDNGERQPDVEGLLRVLKEVLEGFDETYIVLDALDECTDRKELLERMGEIQGWKLRQLRMLVTSRWLIDIKESLEPLTESRGRICIQSSLVDADILTYVRGRLQNDRDLKRWRGMPQVQEEIETTLKEKANGMFRWALLLKNGADVNAQGGHHGNALQAASHGGHESVVQLLLKNEADVNAQGGKYGSALQAASFDGHESVVQLLLRNGADVNAQGGEYGSALEVASFDGHESVVQLLLKNGADVNAQGGKYGSALQAAFLKGDELVV